MYKKIVICSCLVLSGAFAFYNYKDKAEEALGTWLMDITKREFVQSIKDSVKAFTGRSKRRMKRIRQRKVIPNISLK